MQRPFFTAAIQAPGGATFQSGPDGNAAFVTAGGTELLPDVAEEISTFATTSSSTSVDLSWEASSRAVDYYVELLDADTLQVVATDTVVGLSTTLSGLPPDGDYEFRVRGRDANGIVRARGGRAAPVLPPVVSTYYSPSASPTTIVYWAPEPDTEVFKRLTCNAPLEQLATIGPTNGLCTTSIAAGGAIFFAGGAGVAVGLSGNDTFSLVPASALTSDCVLIRTRSAPHIVEFLALADTDVTLRSLDGSALQTVPVVENDVGAFTFTANGAYRVTADTPGAQLAVTARSGNPTDQKPVLPAATTLYGVASNSLFGAAAATVTVTLNHSDTGIGAVNGNLGPGQGANGTVNLSFSTGGTYTGAASVATAASPVHLMSSADGGGSAVTPWQTLGSGTRTVAPFALAYLVLIAPVEETVDIFAPGDDPATATPVESTTIATAGETGPVRRVRLTSAAATTAGAVIQASGPFVAIAENDASDDEFVLPVV